MNQVKFYEKYPALEQVLAIYFNNQLEDEEIGKDILLHFVSEDALGKIKLGNELIAIMGTGDALRFFTEYPYTWLVNLPEESTQAAERFLIDKIWHCYWPNEALPYL